MRCKMEEYITVTKAQEEFLKKYLPTYDTSESIANFFSIFSDNTRVRILSALSIADMCVGDICYLLNLNQTTVSHQLKILRDSKIVASKRDGKIIVYTIINPFVSDVMVTGVDNLDRERGVYKIVD